MMGFSRGPAYDFLLPFLQLPALRFCIGFTTEDGALVYGEDVFQRQFTKNGLTFASTATGVPYANFVGASLQYLSTPDAAWNRFPGSSTVIAIIKATPAVGVRIVSKDPGSPNRGYELQYNDSTAGNLTVNWSEDGAALRSYSLTNGVNTSAWNFVAARQIVDVSTSLWGNDVTVTSATVPLTCFPSSAALEIGRRSAHTAYFTGSMAVVAMCAAALDDAHIVMLRNHAKKFGVA